MSTRSRTGTVRVAAAIGSLSIALGSLVAAGATAVAAPSNSIPLHTNYSMAAHATQHHTMHSVPRTIVTESLPASLPVTLTNQEYSEPDYAEDLRNGVTSGITHHTKTANPPARLFGLSQVQTSTIDYEQVFTASITPNSGSVSDGTPRLRVEIKFPSSSKTGDKYTLQLNAPWTFASATPFEIKDAEGRSFAIAQMSSQVIDDLRFRNLMVIELAENVETHADIEGFFELPLSYKLRTDSQSTPIKVSVWDGPTLTTSGTWTIPGQVPEKTTIHGNSHLVRSGQPAVEGYARTSYSAVPASGGVTIKFTGTSGANPQCTAGLNARSANPAGWIVDQTVQIKAESCADHSATFLVTREILDGMGISGSQMWTLRNALLTDEALTQYRVTVNTDPAISSTGLDNWSGMLTSGDPLAAGANHLALITEKTALVETLEESDKPTPNSQPITGHAAVDAKAKVGDRITYTINTRPLESNGRPLIDITTVDHLPTEVRFLEASNEGVFDPSSHTITWGPNNIMSGGATYTILVEIIETPESGKLTNLVTNQGEEICTGSDQISICSDEATTPVARLDLTFEKHSSIHDTNGNSWVGDLGDTITYQFKLTNTGEVQLTSAKLDDPLLGVQGHECLQEPLEPGNTIECPGTFEYEITAEDVASELVVNRATVTVPGLPPKEDQAIDPTVNPSFSFNKSVKNAPKKAKEGDIIAYKFTVKNTGNVDLMGVTITDPLLGAKDVTCLPEDAVLRVGESVDCEHNPLYDYKVTKADVSTGKVHNVATAKVRGLPERRSETTTPVGSTPTAVPPKTTPDPGTNNFKPAKPSNLARTGSVGSWVAGMAILFLIAGGLTVTANRRKSEAMPTVRSHAR